MCDDWSILPRFSSEAFEKDRVQEVLATTHSAKEDVTALFQRIEEFAGKAMLDDDTTVASIEITHPGARIEA